jgi:hypothetical protein
MNLYSPNSNVSFQLEYFAGLGVQYLWGVTVPIYINNQDNQANISYS